MRDKPNYVGIDSDSFGGMTPTGNIIRDAWVFGIIPDDETCAGWTVQEIQTLYDKVSEAWAPYGHLSSNLPPDLRERHRQIYETAVRKARAMGWDPAVDDEET